MDSEKIEPYSQESCQEIYGAIGTFLHQADIEWKQNNYEKFQALTHSITCHDHLKCGSNY